MSDIVLKDKSGVKNTYSDIETINIPDGNGGFVKYSLGGTHLPYYDGAVIIEKAESVLGLRKFKSSMTVASSEVFTDNTDTAFEQYGFSISPITFEEAGITITGLSCLLNFNNQDVIGEGVLTYIEGDIGIGAIAQTLTYLSTLGIDTFNVTATNNSTVDKWLLANTEPVDVPSVLGLRRFKDTLTNPFPTPTNTYIHNKFGFDIPNIELSTDKSWDSVGYGYWSGDNSITLAYYWKHTNSDTVGSIVVYEQGEWIAPSGYTIDDVKRVVINSIPEDATFKNWLLANTEGVSV